MNTESNNQDHQVLADAQSAEQTEPVAEPTNPSPGTILSAQRESLELTIQQVADKLNLTMHYVRCLESDSYDKLPGDVFVRGYIRTYANLLQLDAPQVVAVYSEFTSKKLARKEEAIKRYARRRNDKNRPWIIVSGVAFVGVALALWYFNVGPSVDEPVEEATMPVSAINSMPLFTPVSSEISAAPVSSEQTGDTALQNGVAATADDQQIGQEIGQQIGQEMQTTDEAGASSMTESAGTLISLSWGGEDSVQLDFLGDSWVEIEDRGSEQSHRELRISGETLLIHGTAPFSILLGNARAVTLTLNGRRVDISGNIRADDTARLSIGM
jgi:cytoskeleton protein RodZ